MENLLIPLILCGLGFFLVILLLLPFGCVKKCQAKEQWLCLGRFTDGVRPKLLESEYSHFYIRFENYCVWWHGVRTYYDFVIIPYTIIKCGCCGRLYWVPHYERPDRGGVGTINEYNETQIKICECLKKSKSILHLKKLLQEGFGENLAEFTEPQKTKNYKDPEECRFGKVVKIIGGDNG